MTEKNTEQAPDSTPPKPFSDAFVVFIPQGWAPYPAELPDRLPAAEHTAPRRDAVAAAFPGAVMRQASSLGNTVVVTLGVGAPDVVEVPNRLGTQPLPTPSISSSPTSSSSPSTSGTTSPSPSPSISTRSADENICS